MAFRARHGAEPQWLGVAPGRVNLIGEHVDYVGGLVLPVAIDRYVAVALGEAPEWDVASSVDGGLPYVRSVAAEAGVGPLRAAIASDLPAGAGLSSSAALLVATAAALVPGLDGVEAARMCRRAEQSATGVGVGIMDQFASALGREGFATLLDRADLDHQPVPVPTTITIAVVDSGVRRRLAETPYDQRRREAELAVAGEGGAALRPRLRHVIGEIARVGEFAAALHAADLARLGRLLDESHASLRDDMEVSTPAVDALVAEARRAPGCLGARIMGAGFGGSILALVESGAEARFEARVAAPVTLCRTASGPYALGPVG